MTFHTHTDTQAGSPVVTLFGEGASVELYGWGCLLNAFRVGVDGKTLNVVDGYASVEDAMRSITPLYKSAKLSPFACRMKNARYTFGGKPYEIEQKQANGHALHGLVYNQDFHLVNTQADAHSATAVFEHDYQRRDSGYPFHYSLRVTWELGPQNRLCCRTTLINRSQTSIPIADGWHPYFNLGGTLDAHRLQVNSNSRMEYDTDMCPTGHMINDDRFENGRLLKDLMLDNGFVLRNNGQPACILQNEKWQLTVSSVANYGFLQLYIPPNRNSIAIEVMSGAPDAFNNGIGLIVLEAGAEKTFEVCYQLTAV